MEMTPLQIASDYRTAKNKTKQIAVLAELNACTQRTIAEILQEQGEELPGHWKEMLAKGLKREPGGNTVTQKELATAIVEAVTPEKETTGDPSTPLRVAQDDTAKGAALSTDGDPASRVGRISWAQYSRLMKIVEILEDLFALAEEMKPETNA